MSQNHKKVVGIRLLLIRYIKHFSNFGKNTMVSKTKDALHMTSIHFEASVAAMKT